MAAWSGHAAVVAELFQHGAGPSIATAQEHLEIPGGSIDSAVGGAAEGPPGRGGPLEMNDYGSARNELH